MSGKTIGRYEIKGELGRGGMAIVYLAYDPILEREVAVKVLPTYFAHEPEFSARFAREAKTVAALEHNAIVSMYDYGEDGEWPYFVMRLMKGGSLKDRLEKGAFTTAEAARILQRVGSALDRAHRRNLVHRDMKPGNIMFDEDGDAYLTDFGIVKIAEGSDNYTQTGNTLGTPAYMSPEQARGVEEIDGRSDIYALGVILYEMLTGDVPYKSDTTLGQAMMHVMDPLPEILEVKPDLPATVDEIIKKAMAKNREERFATALELATAVEAAADGKTTMVSAVPKPVPETAVTPVLETEMPPVPESVVQASEVEAAPAVAAAAQAAAEPEPEALPEEVVTMSAPLLETPVMEPTAVVTTPPTTTKPIAAATSPYNDEAKKGTPTWLYIVGGVVALVVLGLIALFVLFDDNSAEDVFLSEEPIEYGESVRSFIDPDEVALYTFSGEANDVVEVIVAPLSDDLDIILDLIDSNGRSLIVDPIDEAIEGQAETLSEQRLPGIGDYTITVAGFNGTAGDFIVTLELLDEGE